MRHIHYARIRDLIRKLQGGVEFIKLDLSHAYQHIELHEKTKQLTTVSTQMGLLEYIRLPFRVASAPAILKNIVQVLQNLEGEVTFWMIH